MLDSPESVLKFWFEEIAPQQWWRKSPEFDRALTERFGALHRSAAASELLAWRSSAKGRVAEVLVLDQFSRHIYRDRPEAFACDAMALALAQTAVAFGLDKDLPLPLRQFLYMPFMHSESKAVHQEALVLFAAQGLEKSLESERAHQKIIHRFGRYPHRNVLLGRVSTDEELEFLKTPHASF
jgi:hypothetical protein